MVKHFFYTPFFKTQYFFNKKNKFTILEYFFLNKMQVMCHNAIMHWFFYKRVWSIKWSIKWSINWFMKDGGKLHVHRCIFEKKNIPLFLAIEHILISPLIYKNIMFRKCVHSSVKSMSSPYTCISLKTILHSTRGFLISFFVRFSIN